MTKQIFFNTGNSFGIGSYKEEIHLSVQGGPSDFYLYDKSRHVPWSKWIKGQSGDYYSLKNTIDSRHRMEFIKLFNELFEEKS